VRFIGLFGTWVRIPPCPPLSSFRINDLQITSSALYRLGLTTQAASRIEIATTALSLPRRLIGDDTIVHTRRPEPWAKLSDRDAALLEVLRCAGGR